MGVVHVFKPLFDVISYADDNSWNIEKLDLPDYGDIKQFIKGFLLDTDSGLHSFVVVKDSQTIAGINQTADKPGYERSSC